MFRKNKFLVQPRKKLDCQARVVLRVIILFPEHKVRSCIFMFESVGHLLHNGQQIDDNRPLKLHKGPLKLIQWIKLAHSFYMLYQNCFILSF